MRSDKWDEKEKEPFNGFQKREVKDHTHEFHGGKCVYCGKTREELRKQW